MSRMTILMYIIIKSNGLSCSLTFQKKERIFMKKVKTSLTEKEIYDAASMLLTGAKIFSCSSIGLLILSAVTNNTDLAWYGLATLSLTVYSVLVSLFIYVRREYNLIEMLIILPCLVINFILGWIAGLPALIIMKIMTFLA